jgi:myo-inositol-1(or 4)-monophosphatase
MDKTREIVESAVRKSGAFVRNEFGNHHTIDFKGEIHLVTEVDLRSEEMIREVLETSFPEDDILAEESGIHKRFRSGRRWLVDPLDGTTNFAHGYPFFAVSVALEVDGEIVYGVVFDPMNEELFSAEKANGGALNGNPIRVSPTDAIGISLIATGFPYDIHDYPQHHVEDLGRVLHHAQGIRRDGSAALDLCYVACGRFDGFYERKLAPWDTAAGKLIVEEAGGRVTRLGGETHSIYDNEILATNGRIHEELIRILER